MNRFDDDSDALLRRIAHAPPRRPPTSAIPGTTWSESGRYVIERMVGRGGMGTVYAATDTVLSRRVALKVLDAVESDAGDHASLLREAQLAAAVEHERIARVYDVGRHEGFAFVAMEYIDGGTLRQAMTGRPLAAAEVLVIAMQIAEGLSALHAKRVIHGDLKPENVMLTESRGIKLLDFGLARVADGGATVHTSGTPGYMAPEQWHGESIDACVDVFALGVIVYELATGERLVRASTTEAMARATREVAPALDALVWDSYPSRFRDDLAAMLAPDPAKRLADGQAALSALRGYAAPAAGLPAATLQPLRRWRRPALRVVELASAATALAILLGARATVVVHRVAPVGMVRIDVGEIEVGRGFFAIVAECGAIGKGCYLPQMLYEIPRTTAEVPPFFLDRDEVANEDLAALLETYRGTLSVADDEDHHYPRFVHRNAGGNGEIIYDLNAKHGGIELVESDGHHAYRPRADRARLPAAQVSWYGAKLYCEAHGKRLPTEDEWEAAARGRDNRRYPWGDAVPRCGEVAIPNDGEVTMSAACASDISARAVGTAPQDATPDGVRDLGGNVAEWTSSLFVEGERGAAITNAPPEMSRVIRGGSWGDSLAVRTSGRTGRPPSIMGANLGFRCAISETDL